MEQFFLLILIFLALLAIFDLFVGVSNDAVNFLNSAIGSRIAPFKVIMIVASLGVLIGATFSSGMMEIARSGVFNPQMFTFSEVIVIFFAVMVTDVLLLDLFNSFGLPTSTTVSIVFELLGGAVAAATFKIWSQPVPFFATLGPYINSEKALAIISGILISVAVAFVAGAAVQYLCRLVFTFNYQKMYKCFGSSFGGIAITAIFYFLVMKGAKGASFMKPEYLDWINANTSTILLVSFLSLTILFQILISLFKTNIFKITILAGTFSLAFAFAGNDLVNFVGVPLAAHESYLQYEVSGIAPDMFSMEGLKQAVKTPTFYLLAAGMVMVLTLWFSKKAHRVVQTSINLSSGNRGAKEQFGSSFFGRSLVRVSLNLNTMLHQVLPNSLFKALNSRMEPVPTPKGEIPLPFDQIRASVNLVVASILIASATSLKLPLSTTYVTFMVAMGSSLADGAWDRECAVYRVSGVLTVIGGWFITALTAFTFCAIVSGMVFLGGNIAVIGLILFVCVRLIYSNFCATKKEESSFDIVMHDRPDKVFICKTVNKAVHHYLNSCVSMYRDGLETFLAEDVRGMKKIQNKADAVFDEVSMRRGDYYRLALEDNAEDGYSDARHYYYRIFTNLKEVGHDLRSVLGTAHNHIDNHHSVYKGLLRNNLERMLSDLQDLEQYVLQYAQRPERDDVALTERANASSNLINQLQLELLRNIESAPLSLRSSELYLNFLQFGRNLINRFTLIALLQHELNEKCQFIPTQDAEPVFV